jgi:spermidine synthase
MTSHASAPVDRSLGPTNRTLAIFLVSVLGLFLELMLIRWISTEIRIFAYLQNTVLVVCFLGLGMGCFTSRRPVNLRGALVALLCLAMILAVPLAHRGVAKITTLLSSMDDLLIWQPGGGVDGLHAVGNVALGLLMTLGLMILLWEIFLPLGRLLGRLLDDDPRTIWAYSVNVAGSFVGIGLFVVLSALWAPPLVWLLVAAALLVVFLAPGRQRLVDLALLAAILAAVWVADRPGTAREVAWSPYQKLVLSDCRAARMQQENGWAGDYLITVNNAGYQGIINLSPEAVRANPHIDPARYGLSQYDVPLLVHPHPRRVLVVGAGSGNDVAGALRGGAEHVTAVEIDPAIVDMGRRFHPERPYASPKVRVVIDDARSFFATTHERFDLIIFGLLDSHTTTAMTNARLDHYVYTQESIARARELLADGGVMALSFEAVKPFIADRMAGCLKGVFGRKPLAFRIPPSELGWGGVMFIAGAPQSIDTALAAHPRLAATIRQWQNQRPLNLTYTTAVAEDNWPYIYLAARRVPTLYFLLAGAMLVLAVFCRQRLGLGGDATVGEPKSGGRPRWDRTQWHFFWLGAAFLLLEVQNISRASVVLGNTWLVNAIIIGGILLMILAANVLEALFPRRLPQGVMTVGLIGSCLVLYGLDLSRFGVLPYAAKAVCVGLLTTMPMFFSGIIFIRSFALVERKDVAMGANMYGALVGGILQSITFLTGIKALLLVVAGLYLAALVTRPRERRAALSLPESSAILADDASSLDRSPESESHGEEDDIDLVVVAGWE